MKRTATIHKSPAEQHLDWAYLPVVARSGTDHLLPLLVGFGLAAAIAFSAVQLLFRVL